MIEVFLGYCEVERGMSRSTLDSYRCDLVQFMKFLGKSSDMEALKGVTVDDARKYVAWLEKKGYSQGTICRRVASLRSFFRFLRRRHGLEVMPIMIQVKHPERQRKLFSSDSVEHMIKWMVLNNYLDYRDRAIILLIFDTGLGLSELAALNRDDLDEVSDGLMLNIEDGRKRSLLITDRTEDAIHASVDMRTDSDPALFSSKFKQRLTIRSISRAIRKRGVDAGIPDLSAGRIRNTFISKMMNAGANWKEIRRHLGLHSHTKHIEKEMAAVDG